MGGEVKGVEDKREKGKRQRMKSISIKSNLYSNRFFVIYRVLPENRKKAWNGNPWDVATMGDRGRGKDRVDRRRQGGKERKKERRTRTLCIFNAIRMHRAKNIVEEEEEGCNFSRHKRTIERELYYQDPDFTNRRRNYRKYCASHQLERWIEEDILNNDKISSSFVIFCTIFV